MRKGTTYEVMLRFFIKADSKSGAWKVLQRISENVRERFPEVVRSEPFDVSEHEDKTSGNCNRERKHNSRRSGNRTRRRKK